MSSHTEEELQGPRSTIGWDIRIWYPLFEFQAGQIQLGVQGHSSCTVARRRKKQMKTARKARNNNSRSNTITVTGSEGRRKVKFARD